MSLCKETSPVTKAFESLRGRYYQQARISQTGNRLIAELLLGSPTGALVRKAGSSYRNFVVLHNCKDRLYAFQKAYFIVSQTLLRGDASDRGKSRGRYERSSIFKSPVSLHTGE